MSNIAFRSTHRKFGRAALPIFAHELPVWRKVKPAAIITILFTTLNGPSCFSNRMPLERLPMASRFEYAAIRRGMFRSPNSFLSYPKLEESSDTRLGTMCRRAQSRGRILYIFHRQRYTTGVVRSAHALRSI